MRYVLIVVTAMLMLVALSCSADDSPSVSLTGTPMTTPTPTPKLAPWSTASAVPVDRDAILAGDNEAWFAVDPNTGQTKRLEPVSGYVPRELAGGRYDQDSPFITKDGLTYRRTHDASEPIAEQNRHAVDQLVQRGRKREIFSRFHLIQGPSVKRGQSSVG